MTTSHSAGAQALGYYYQISYSLYYILEGNDDLQLAVERADDIETVDRKGLLQLVQTKLHANPNSHITNGSVDFWKTLAIWSNYLATGKFLPKSTALFLVTTSKALPDTIPYLLSRDSRDLGRALIKIHSYAGNTDSPKIREYAAAFLRLKEEQQCLLLNCITILDQSLKPSEIQSEVTKHFKGVHPEYREAVYEALLGWWFDRVVSHLLNKSSEFITQEEVVERIAYINDNYKSGMLPFPSENLEPPESVEVAWESLRFVQHLQSIRISLRRIINAVHDRNCTVMDKSHWARTKLLFDSDFGKYDKKLIQEWGEKFDAVVDDYTTRNQKNIELDWRYKFTVLKSIMV